MQHPRAEANRIVKPDLFYPASGIYLSTAIQNNISLAPCAWFWLIGSRIKKYPIKKMARHRQLRHVLLLHISIKSLPNDNHTFRYRHDIISLTWTKLAPGTTKRFLFTPKSFIWSDMASRLTWHGEAGQTLAETARQSYRQYGVCDSDHCAMHYQVKLSGRQS